jgi:S-(hydroxymethyl)mycothiol dehydrogenase
MAYEVRDSVGACTPDMRIELPAIEVFGRGGAVRSSWYGDCPASRDFPMLRSVVVLDK